MTVLGYCNLCRAKEVELFGTVVDGERHRQAVKEAGCGHPAEYHWNAKNKGAGAGQGAEGNPEIIDVGGWRWEIDKETHALYFMDDEESFFEAVVFLREVN
jgi:hypothetical protein